MSIEGLQLTDFTNPKPKPQGVVSEFVNSIKTSVIPTQIHVLVCPDTGLMFNDSLDLVDNFREAEIFTTKEAALSDIKYYGYIVNNCIEVKSFNVTPV